MKFLKEKKLMKIKVALCFLFSILVFAGYAQKLPAMQMISLRAPASLKVDGKSVEWGNKFQAYNHATDIFYTICNDDDNLYLIIQITDPVIINKVVSAGITIVVNTTGKKGDENGVSITYPIFDVKDRPMVDLKNPPKISPGSAASDVSKADSFMTDNNNRLKAKSKYIKVTGAKDLDSLVSIYNRDGIKAAELFDNRMAYTYELSVGLKHFGISITDAAKFAYEIKLNGATISNLNGITSLPPKPGHIMGSMIIGPGAMSPSTIPVMTSTTSFWGDYTLIKK